jgi:hypothetical protein
MPKMAQFGQRAATPTNTHQNNMFPRKHCDSEITCIHIQSIIDESPLTQISEFIIVFILGINM